MRSDRLRAFCQAVSNQFPGLRKFVSGEGEARRAYALAAHANLFLNKLDQLHELRNSIKTQQRQEPAVKFKSFLGLSVAGELEQPDRLFGKCIHEAGNPSDCAGIYSLNNRAVNADSNLETISSHSPESRHPADICARFLDGMQVRKFGEQFIHLLGKEIRSVGDWIVVKHTRQCRV